MTNKEIRDHVVVINSMSQTEMALLWRSAPLGHPYFDRRLPLFTLFKKRFDELGGMTSVVSKIIGLE